MELDLRKEKSYWIGRYEPRLQQYLSQNIGAGDVVYDVGAHVGFFSICSARLGARVVAVEPDPVNADRLRRNANLNGFDIDVIEAAAWSESGRVELVPGESSKEHVVAPGDGIASVTLDELTRHCPAPTLIKMDVEGAEDRVLEGARRILAERRPVVICEIHGEVQRASVLAQLRSYAIAELGTSDRLVARPSS
jgi:FkbM family methyltransferase